MFHRKVGNRYGLGVDFVDTVKDIWIDLNRISKGLVDPTSDTATRLR